MSSALEAIQNIDLEKWLTLNTAASSTKLDPGQTPDMKNVWTDEKPGSIITAPGFRKVGQAPSGNPCSFCINYFKTSSGTQTFVVSDNATVWTTVDFQNFTTIITGLSSSFQLRGKVIRDKLWLTNGSDAVRTFDGAAVVVLDGTNSTPTVPRGRYIDYHDERVWLYHISSNRSACYFSSLTDDDANIIPPDDPAAWDTADNFLQISEGDADFGTGLLIYRGYLHFFKQYSIWRLVGYDEYTYSRVKTRASTGTRFNESVQILDSLVHLIGVDGIYVFDGEESDRISDLIDPATASQTAFGFNQLQQPNQNNQFWEVSSTQDWETGTLPSNIEVDNEIDLIATDDSQADFQAGPTQTNIDLVTSPGNIQMGYTGFAAVRSAPNIALGTPCTLNIVSGMSTVGAGSFATDGDSANSVGFQIASTGAVSAYYEITLPASYPISFITFKNWRNAVNFSVQVLLDGNVATLDSVIDPIGFASIVGNKLVDGKVPPVTRDIALGLSTPDHSAVPVGTVVRILLTATSSIGNTFTVTDLVIQATTFKTSGQFISKTLDLGLAPGSAGTFNATEVLNSEGTSYFTQSSDDGVSWDTAAAVANGGTISSALKRYLRWGVNLTSDGQNTPVISAAFLPSVYISAIHNTGGNIFAWGPLESDRTNAAQSISYFYRTAFFSGGIAAATWNLIVPGGVLSDPIANQYVQFKIDISGGDASHLPTVSSVTINWVVGVAGQAQTLQNVASAYWRNRYWLSAAGASATANNTVLIRGKKTFQSPWILKDWNILSFTRFQDSLYGCSSIDGSIYQLDTGYSKDTQAMDSYFETGDFIFNGFTANLIEIVIEVERMGSWNLAVGVSLDNGNTWTEKLVDLSLSTYDNNYIKKLNFNMTTTRFRIRFRTNGIDTPFQVHRCIAYYKLESERGSVRGDYRPS